MKNDITGALSRLIFVLWIFSGVVGLIATVAGAEEVSLAGLGTFVGVIVLTLAYALVKWIITGES